MKRSMHRFFATAFAVAALATVPTAAQAQVSFGATAAYHVDIEALGVGAVLQAPLEALHENVNFLGDFTWYFPDVVDYFEVNGNLTYDFPLEGDAAVTPFGLGGLVIARTSFDTEGTGFDGSNTDVGLNLGGGVKFGGNLQPMVGGRLQLRDGSGFVIFGSILFGGG